MTLVEHASNRLWSPREKDRRIGTCKSESDRHYTSLYIDLQDRYESGTISAEEFLNKTNSLHVTVYSNTEPVLFADHDYYRQDEELVASVLDDPLHLFDAQTGWEYGVYLR